ncbi:MAG: hypothetical protein RL154_343 [Pseudomonadota bacterium]
MSEVIHKMSVINSGFSSCLEYINSGIANNLFFSNNYTKTYDGTIFEWERDEVHTLVSLYSESANNIEKLSDDFFQVKIKDYTDIQDKHCSINDALANQKHFILPEIKPHKDSFLLAGVPIVKTELVLSHSDHLLHNKKFDSYSSNWLTEMDSALDELIVQANPLVVSGVVLDTSLHNETSDKKDGQVLDGGQEVKIINTVEKTITTNKLDNIKGFSLSEAQNKYQINTQQIKKIERESYSGIQAAKIMISDFSFSIFEGSNKKCDFFIDNIEFKTHIDFDDFFCGGNDEFCAVYQKNCPSGTSLMNGQCYKCYNYKNKNYSGIHTWIFLKILLVGRHSY